jgi:hypothetical protein
MVVPFYKNDDVQGACNKVTDTATNQWKKEDDVIDDITCIVIFLSVPKS